MLFTLWLDDLTVGHDAQGRIRVREALEHELNAPFDEMEREEYERDAWGTSEEARQAAEQADELFQDATYEG